MYALEKSIGNDHGEYLHLANFDEPVADVLGSGEQDAVAMAVGLIEDRFQVLDARRHSDGQFATLRRRVRARVQRRVVAVADFFHARSQLLSLVEADEDDLSQLGPLKKKKRQKKVGNISFKGQMDFRFFSSDCNLR